MPTIVQHELAKWLRREVGEEEMERVVAFTEKCHVVALDMGLAIAAAEVSARDKLATADAIIYATAQAQGADVLTCDAHFKNLENVMFVSKLSA